jgi:hypothetical protein
MDINEVKRTSGGPASCHGRSLEWPRKASPPGDESTCVPWNAVWGPRCECGERTWTAIEAASLCVKCMVIGGLPLGSCYGT